MSKPEYDEFYYTKDTQGIVEFADALVKDSNNRDTLSNEYDRDYLFCPECMMAKLKFTPEYPPRKAFLSFVGNGDTEHSDICSHRLSLIGKREASEYYDNLTEQQIENKLNSAIEKFLRHSNPTTSEHVHDNPDNNPSVAVYRKDNNVIRKRLLTRSIYSIYDIDNDELNIPILLYGIVKLSVEQHKSKYEGGNDYFYINILSKNTNKRIRFFYRASNKDIVDEDAIYYISLIAFFKRDDNGKLKSELLSQSAIKYIKI